MKILAVTTAPHSAVSFYRTMGTLPYLKGIEVKLADTINWPTLAGYDCLFMERPVKQEFLDAALIAQDFNIPVWVDLDDDLFHLPAGNPGKAYFDKQSTQDVLKRVLKIASLCTVTTPGLAKVYRPVTKKLEIVPNAFNDFNFRWEKCRSDKRTILWRGSQTHREDIRSVLPEMVTVAVKNPSWKWVWIGNDLWYVAEHFTKEAAVFFNEQPQLDYWKLIRGMNPSVMNVPLTLNQFNEGKSNIAWIEGTYAGAAVIAPDMPEWRRPGVTTYSNREEYAQQMERLLTDEKFRKKNYEASFDWIQKNLMLSKVNELRKKALEEIV